MNKIRIGKFGMVVIPAILIAVSACSAAEFTAMIGLLPAQKAATAWHADATLTRVGTTALKGDDKAIVWQYDYVSPSTVKCARILIIGGGDPRLQDLGKCTPAKPVPSDFVDSPIMLKAAVQAGFKPNETSDAYLAFMQDSATQDRACWVVQTIADFDRTKSHMRGWCVDPKTGKFVVRLNGESGPKKY